jgi:hypothetical protein
VLAIVPEDMKILGGLTIFLQKQAIKGVLDFKEGKMPEVLANAFNRQGFFIERLIPTLWLLRVIPFSLYRKL